MPNGSFLANNTLFSDIPGYVLTVYDKLSPWQVTQFSCPSEINDCLLLALGIKPRAGDKQG